MDEYLSQISIGAVIVIAVQYIILGAWLFSPFSGVKVDDIKRKPGTLFSSSALLLGLDLILVSGFYFLEKLSPDYAINSSTTLILTLIFAPMIALVVGTYISWVLARPDSSVDAELKSNDIQSDFSFQERRRKRLSKSSKRR